MATFMFKAFGRVLRRRRRRTHAGLPPGLDPAVMHEVCERKLGAPLRATRFIHLSGWKATGAYRVELVSTRGQQLSVIFKQAVYDAAEIPALRGFPITPGLPENIVYANNEGALARFLPEVLVCREVEPGRMYHYVLEDLSATCREPAGDADLSAIVKRLPALHDTLSAWARDTDTTGLLVYDETYQSGVWSYIRDHLTLYRNRGTSEALRRVMGMLDAMHELWQCSSEEIARQVVHGDLNVTNIWLAPDDSPRLVDWEWSGWAVPHTDLVALLKHAPPQLEQQLLDAYALERGDIDRARHRWIYRRCRLERSLVDAAFLAAQIMGNTSSTHLNVAAHIEKALAAALRVFGEMQRQAP